jgi:peroxiredoxin
MDAVLVVARLVLAGVFATAGVAKLGDRAAARQALGEFGVPQRLGRTVAVGLPIAELAVAAGLIPAATAWWSALAGLGLLLAFVAGIAFNLIRGRRPACRCFGELSAKPLGWKTLVRTALLAAVAGFVVAVGRVDAGPGPGALTTLGVVALLGLGFLLVQTWLLVHVLRQNGRLLVRVEALEARTAPGGGRLHQIGPVPPAAVATTSPGLPVGTPAPNFSAIDLDGRPVTLAELRVPGRPLVLIFSDPDCRGCATIYPSLAHWQRQHAEEITAVLISRGDPERHRALSAEHGMTRVVLENPGDDIMAAYRVDITPAAVMIGPDGAIATDIGRGTAGADALVSRVIQHNHNGAQVLSGRPS